jgi:hypothetical protein
MQDDRALPLAIDRRPETVPMALRYSDVVKILDEETLRVTNLSDGKYRLQIDDEMVGVFDPQELARGINLGLLPTPMAKQSLAVQVDAFKHNNLHLMRWRMVEDAFKDDHLPGTRLAAEALDALEEQAVELQRVTAQPKPHRYRLYRIPSATNSSDLK